MTFRQVQALVGKLLEQHMSQLIDKITAIDAKVDAVASEVADLKAKIAASPSAEDVTAAEAKLDSISAKLDAIVAPTPPGHAST